MKILVEEYGRYIDAAKVFLSLAAEPDLAFLDSNSGYGRLGRWSVLACRPWKRLRGWPDYCLVDGQRIDDNPLTVLRTILQEIRCPPQPELPLLGGCIGALAYDAGFELNYLQIPAKVDRSAPLARFDFYDLLVVFDHQEHRTWLMACGRQQPAREGLAWLREKLAAAELLPAADPPAAIAGSAKIEYIPARRPYMQKVEQLREWIRQGEVYITNLTTRLRAVSDADPLLLYRMLRRQNPSPFAAFIRQEDIAILSASPERFIEIRPEADRWKIETRPIKGTRPRSSDRLRDEQNRRELIESEKDRSELLMIVDLERNDLSRICTPESVRVSELFALETYPEVYHLVATVNGILRPEVDAAGCLEACFPGGSITGAPKMRSMQLIDRLEEDARGFYTGCLGYFSADGQADFSIIIRTMVWQDGRISYGTGGGITWESEAAAEYQEILDKARTFRRLMQDDPD